MLQHFPHSLFAVACANVVGKKWLFLIKFLGEVRGDDKQNNSVLAQFCGTF